MIESLYILIVCAISCGLIGVFVMLRGLSMVTDAISHSVLLGIILAFFVTHSIDSPLLLISASVFGLLTVFLIEMLGQTGYVKKEDAVGIVFPIFFALAVILITKFARNVHVDTEVVLMGEVILSPLNRIVLFGISIPKFLVVNIVMLLINVAFIAVFYKELKVSTFDEEFAVIAGFSSTALFYALMTLVSMTSVASFNAVGSILVISFLITPGATAYLLTKNLKSMLVLTAIFGVISSVVGFYLSIHFNVSMAGMCAVIGMLLFLVVTVVNPNGIVTKFILRGKNKREQLEALVLIHIGRHTGKASETEELGKDTIYKHLNWEKTVFEKKSEALIKSGLVTLKSGIYYLTKDGEQKLQEYCNRYGVYID